MTEEHINDTFLRNESNYLTRGFLEIGMELNRVCMFVKDYQKKYICIKEQSPIHAKKFTAKMWWKLSSNGNEFRLAI